MADYHIKSFFGVDSALIFTSPSRAVPYIFINCIRKKEDKNWEKPSKGEGKTVKLSIEEIICILEVLHRKSANWRGYHVFKEYKTEIYVGWEDQSRQVVMFRIGNYVKKISFPNLNFLTLLLEHILSEKIEFATSGTFEPMVRDSEQSIEGEDQYGVFSEHITASDGLQVVETTEYGVSIETMDIIAKIKVESPKALLINLDSGEEFWIPKSTIHNKYDIKERDKHQNFIVDKWIIEKNKIMP